MSNSKFSGIVTTLRSSTTLRTNLDLNPPCQDTLALRDLLVEEAKKGAGEREANYQKVAKGLEGWMKAIWTLDPVAQGLVAMAKAVKGMVDEEEADRLLLEESDREIEAFLAQEKAREEAKAESYRLAHLPPSKKRGSKVSNGAKIALAPKPQELVDLERESSRLEREILAQTRKAKALEESKAKEEANRIRCRVGAALKDMALAIGARERKEADRKRTEERKALLLKRQEEFKSKQAAEFEAAQAALRGEMSFNDRSLVGEVAPSKKQIAKERIMERRMDNSEAVARKVAFQREYIDSLKARLQSLRG